MPHDPETTFSDLASTLSNLWFVDVSEVIAKNISQATKDKVKRPLNRIRKILVHHHAGFPHDLSKKQKVAGQPDYPEKYYDYASGAYKARLYGYHYDLPFVEEKSPDGTKRVVYVTGSPERDQPHTGGGQNNWGIGISLVGTARGSNEFPDARYFGSKHAVPEQYKTDRGMPSENQRLILPVLVRWLQEKHKIADAHVQAHFQWGKPSCPGYDTERWVMWHGDRARREGRGFSYPIALSKGTSGPPYLKPPKQEPSRAAEYLRNTLKARSGSFPFGRRHFWHNGVHLFPEGGAGTDVHAVRDGWVVAARFDKNVKVKTADGTEVDYGSANFVIVQHEDPGLVDKEDKRTSIDEVFTINKQGQNLWLGVPAHPHYYSLYMHLGKLDTGIAWVKRLKEEDSKFFEKIEKKPGEVYDFTTGNKVALPVKTGEVIGKVGLHDPFAARPANLKVEHPEIFDAKNKAVLHFEMFSGYNLVQRFDTDRDRHKAWTIDDTDADAFAKAAEEHLDKVTGLSSIAPGLKDKISKMEELDKRHLDPSRWSDLLDDATLDALSKVVAHHISEWGANWKGVIDNWFREWGLVKGKPDKAQKAAAEHAVKVADAFKIKWTYPAMKYRRPALDKNPYFYHPIRLLNWLNGLERTPDHDLPFNNTDATAFDISPRKVKVAAPGAAGATELLLDKASAQGLPKFSEKPNTEFPDKTILDLGLLKGSRFRLADSETIHTISSSTGEKEGQRIAFSPVLASELKKGDQVRFGLIGWHWESKFAWDEKIL